MDRTFRSRNSIRAKARCLTKKRPSSCARLLVDFPIFKDFHAAAILGNMGAETGGFTLMQEVRPRAGRGGLGWLQWTGPRRIDFETFCQPPNPSTATDEGNYNFMVHEMRGKERKARELFEVTTNLDDATQVFMLKYERPGVKALEKRKTFARRAFSLFRDAPPAGNSTFVADVVGKLSALIDSGKIIFDKASLKDELLGRNGGVKVTPKLQALVVRISGLAAPQQLRISSLVRPGVRNVVVRRGEPSISATRKLQPRFCPRSRRTSRSESSASTS